MERHFEHQLELLATTIQKMGGLVEQAIGKSVEALVKRDPALAAEVIREDQQIDELELEIDKKGRVYVRIDRKRKLPITVLLRSMGYVSNEQILELFDNSVYIQHTIAADTEAEAVGDPGIDDYIVTAVTLELSAFQNGRLAGAIWLDPNQGDIQIAFAIRLRDLRRRKADLADVLYSRHPAQFV